MDALSSAENPAKNLEDDMAYHLVPSNLYEFIQKPNGLRILLVKDPDLLHYRKFKPNRGKDSEFFCCGCYLNHGKKVLAYFSNGKLQAPRFHDCVPRPLKDNEIKRIKVEPIDGNPGSSSASSVLPPPVTSESVGASGDDPNRPISRESDIIFLDDDDLKVDYKDTVSTTEKVESLKDGSSLRSITPEEYEFAYSGGGCKRNRLIVFEENDPSHVKQYAGNQNRYWYCLGCFRSCKKHTQAFENRDETFLVPKVHFCKPIPYEDAKAEQQKIMKKWRIDESAVSVTDDENDVGDVGDENEKNNNENGKKLVKDGKRRNRSREVSPQPFLQPSDRNPVSSRLRARSKTPDAGVATQPAATNSTSSIKRIVEEGRYFFGVGSQNQSEGRIYVYVDGDDSHVHEYRNNKKSCYCCSRCFVLDKTKPRKMASWNRGILRVPDGHICTPLPLAQVEEDQEKIKQKFALGNNVRNSKKRPVTVTLTSSTVSTATPFGPRVLLPVRKVLPTPTTSNTLLHRQKTPFRRDGTPHPSSSTTPQGIKRRVERPNKNTGTPPAPKRAKPVETSEQLNVSKESDIKYIPQKQLCSGQTFVLQNPFLLNVDKPAAQERSHNSSTSAPTSASTNSSTSVNPMPTAQPMVLQQPNVLYSTRSHRTPSPFNFQNVLDDVQSPKNDQPLLTPISSTPSTTPSLPPIPSAPFPTSDSATTISFYKPSSYFLKECCEKVGIEYQDEAYDFWNQIKIKQILPASTPKSVHSTSEPEYFGFDCISILLTGAETQARQIREKINQYIYQQNSEIGIPINRGTEGRAIFSPFLTEYHLPWISKLFKFRVGIFSGNQWKRYGNWTLDDGTPIFLLEYKNSKYSPIMTFD